MAEISEKVIKKGFKLVSVTDFRRNYAGGVTPQAIKYAIDHDHLDYVQIGPNVKAIVLTEKTLEYSPNASSKRDPVPGGEKEKMEL